MEQSTTTTTTTTNIGETRHYDSLVNRLTKDDIDAIFGHYQQKYEFVENDKGCKIMGKKLKEPRKRSNRQQPDWKPLARKKDGYLQVTIAGISAKERPDLFPNGKLQKVEWHRLCWRRDNEYAKCQEGLQICHLCGIRDCGTTNHLVQADRATNEEHKYCSYFYTKRNGKKRLYTNCEHKPCCIPKLEAKKLHRVKDEKIVNKVFEK